MSNMSPQAASAQVNDASDCLRDAIQTMTRVSKARPEDAARLAPIMDRLRAEAKNIADAADAIGTIPVQPSSGSASSNERFPSTGISGGCALA